MSHGHELPGRGFQNGPLRPDWGDGWADLRCDRCGATWVGPLGEVCSFCEEIITAVGGEVPHPADTVDDADSIELTVVTLTDFANVAEEGAEPLLGDSDDILIPANGDVMMYGDGGAGKTTLCLDLACHLAAGVGWLTINVAQALGVLLVENEGPRPLFRAKARRKLEAWTGADLGGRVRIVEAPWAAFTFAAQSHREALAKVIADNEIDFVIVGPLAAAGMTDAGTLREVRLFIALCDDVRRRSGRNVTFLLIHHENKGGKVSGAWEGAGDTLFHVQGMGSGRTRLHIQKARWSTKWHAQTVELRWTDGESFAVEVKPEVSDDDAIVQLLAVIGEHPGTGWSNVERLTPGMRADRRRRLRDRLLADGRIINIVRDEGVERALDHCPERRPARLFHADDPTISHLRPSADADGTQIASAGGPRQTESASLRPDLRRDAGRDADVGGDPRPPEPDRPSLLDTLAAELGATPEVGQR